MLYELLCGEMPYVPRGERISAAAVLDRVLAGPPIPVRSLVPRAPEELVAICDKAMARDPSLRYADMREMAQDLRAYLELRVVRAHRTGAIAEFGKWITRNRRFSAALAGAGLIAIGALAIIAVLQGQSRNRLQLLADSRAPAELVARSRALQPAVPEQVPAMERWLEEARDLVHRLPAYRREFDDLRRRSLPWDPEGPGERAATRAWSTRKAGADRLVDYYEGEVRRIERDGGESEEGLSLDDVHAKLGALRNLRDQLSNQPRERLTWSFSDPQDQLRHDTLAALLGDVTPLLDSTEGEGLLSVIQHRRDFARIVLRETLDQPATIWAAAIESIRDPRECPLYRGLEIRPQLGLVPLRRDPRSGLWEFLHRESGEPPTVGGDGRYVLLESTGIVLVLLPGGRFGMGAQNVDPSGTNYDPRAEPLESDHGPSGPIVNAILAPFFLSKYEMTQAQWRRCAGRNPSQWTPDSRPAEVQSLLHPVESVDWDGSLEACRALGLTLPSEAQWEYAARSGTTTPWWTGQERESLLGAANLADRRAVETRLIPTNESQDWPGLDDGFGLHAPIGSFRANGFGFHDVSGNVAEWCLDTGGIGYQRMTEVRIDTFERISAKEGLRVRRGGHCGLRASAARSSARSPLVPEYVGPDTGLRPARELDR
jgi:formylglycine-generating enzyme required for sulfatase activity